MVKSVLYTVGHSTHAIGDFCALLERHSVTVLCDVRSHPSSAHNPQFNRGALSDSLQERGMRYLYLGGELGGRGGVGDYDENGVVDYRKLRRGERFADGCRQVLKLLADGETPALMCAERNPFVCHRTLLVAPVLRDKTGIRHILADGSVQSHDDLEKQLLAMHPPSPLFAGDGDGIGDAYLRQARRFAHRKTAAVK